MPLSPRKEEVQGVADAIEAATPKGLDAAAKAAIKEAFAALQRRRLWVIATDAHLLYGPYASQADAYNALAGKKVPGFEDKEDIKAIRKEKGIPSLGGKAAVLAMSGPLALENTQEEVDLEAHRVANRLCATCDHKLLAHGVHRNSVGCSVYGCTCPSPKAP